MPPKVTLRLACLSFSCLFIYLRPVFIWLVHYYFYCCDQSGAVVREQVKIGSIMALFSPATVPNHSSHIIINGEADSDTVKETGGQGLQTARAFHVRLYSV